MLKSGRSFETVGGLLQLLSLRVASLNRVSDPFRSQSTVLCQQLTCTFLFLCMHTFNNTNSILSFTVSIYFLVTHQYSVFYVTFENFGSILQQFHCFRNLISHYRFFYSPPIFIAISSTYFMPPSTTNPNQRPTKGVLRCMSVCRRL